MTYTEEIDPTIEKAHPDEIDGLMSELDFCKKRIFYLTKCIDDREDVMRVQAKVIADIGYHREQSLSMARMVNEKDMEIISLIFAGEKLSDALIELSEITGFVTSDMRTAISEFRGYDKEILEEAFTKSCVQP